MSSMTVSADSHPMLFFNIIPTFAWLLRLPAFCITLLGLMQGVQCCTVSVLHVFNTGSVLHCLLLGSCTLSQCKALEQVLQLGQPGCRAAAFLIEFHPLTWHSPPVSNRVGLLIAHTLQSFAGGIWWMDREMKDTKGRGLWYFSSDGQRELNEWHWWTGETTCDRWQV